jgi:hypothetical protein
MHKIALVLAIAAIGEGAVTLHLVRQLHAQREISQALQARVTELQRAAPGGATPGATFVAVPTQPVTSPFSTAAKAGAPAPVAAVAGSFAVVDSFNAGNLQVPPDRAAVMEQMNASMERQRALMKDPDYREAMHAQQKVMLMRGNPDVGKDLDLTAEQVDRLFGTLAEQSLRGMDNMGAFQWNEQPDAAKMQELNRKQMEQQRANEAELKAVLGEAKYREWQDYQASMGPRMEASRLRTSLASAGLPLDEHQVKPLVKALQEHQNKVLREITAREGANQLLPHGSIVSSATFVGDSVQIMQDSTEVMAKSQRQQREALAQILTPEQLKVIEDEQNTELQMQRAQLRIMQAQKEAGMLEQNVATN